MKTELNQQQALQVLISAVQVATKRGAFELAETETILQAVKTFTDASKTPQNAPDSTQTEEVVEDTKEK